MIVKLPNIQMMDTVCMKTIFHLKILHISWNQTDENISHLLFVLQNVYKIEKMKHQEKYHAITSFYYYVVLLKIVCALSMLHALFSIIFLFDKLSIRIVHTCSKVLSSKVKNKIYSIITCMYIGLWNTMNSFYFSHFIVCIIFIHFAYLI